MTVISSKEFAINSNKYFELAMSEPVYIEHGENIFHLIYINNDNVEVKKRMDSKLDEDSKVLKS